MTILRKIAVLIVALLFSTIENHSLPINITYPDYESIRPTVALVLSGGGARGVSQIGAIEELEKTNLPIDFIVGTSIGSIIGGLFASGYSSSQLDSIINYIDWNKMFSLSAQNNRNDLFLDQKIIEDRSLLTLRFKNFKFVVPEAISTGDEFNMTLQNVFWNSLYKPDGDFNNLKFKFRAVSTDLISGNSISHRYGSLISAVRASATIPLRYTPVRIDSMILIDGGIFSNVPVSAALEFNPDMIISINTVSPLLQASELNNPWNIADQVISISMDKFTQEQLKLSDYTITPNIAAHKNTDFRAFDTLIEKGRLAARSLINDINVSFSTKVDSILYSNFNFVLDTFDFSNKTLIINGFQLLDSLLISNSFPKIDNVGAYSRLIGKILKNGIYKEINAVFDNDIVHFTATRFNNLIQIQIIGCTSNEVRDYADELSKNKSDLVLNKKGINSISEAILAKYRELGYSYAGITSVREDRHGNVFLTIDEGFIHEIRIIGNENTSRFLIQRELKFKEGQPINANKIVRGWNNLKRTELFSSVEIFIEEDPETNANILFVKVIEGGTQAIRIGGRIDNERYTQIGIDAIQENLFNAGIRATARIAYGSRNQDYSFLLDNPRISKTQYSFNSAVYYSYKNIKNYVLKSNTPQNRFARKITNEFGIDRFGAKVSLGQQIERNGLFDVEYRLEKQRHYNIDSSKQEFTNISTLKVSTKFDTENRVDFPSSGQYIELSLETGVLSIKPSANYSKAYFYYHSNHKMGDVVAKPSILFGVADKTLPYPEFFSLGGESTFYGYREDEELGRQIFRGSLELRGKLPFQIFFNSYLALRYDIGSTWEKPESVRFDKLKHGAGVSLQLDTPLGPAKFSLGRAFYFAANPNKIVLGETLAYFSIGMRL